MKELNWVVMPYEQQLVYYGKRTQHKERKMYL
jgi:hypothetical protein